MQRILYVITAHRNPQQVGRLVHALLRASPGGQVLLHYDPSGPPLGAGDLPASPRVHLFPAPIEVRWGDFTMVRAMLDLMSWANERLSFDWLVWLSGQDYPLGPLAGFEQSLDDRYDGIFRHFPALDHPGWLPGEGLRRYYFQYWELPHLLPFHRLPGGARILADTLRKLFNRVQAIVNLRPRQRNNPAKIGFRCRSTPFSNARVCFGGWSWININARCVRHILDFTRANPSFVRHYRRTYCPDESFFHTILANAPDLKLRNDPLRHVAWGDNPYPSHPTTIVSGQMLQHVLDSGMPFARKFDIAVDSACLDVIDLRIAAGLTG